MAFKKIVSFVILGIIALGVLATACVFSYHKYFWGDEAFEIVGLCQATFADIVRGDIIQANKNPLYFLLQKIVISTVSPFGVYTPVFYRSVSIVSAFLLVLLWISYIRRHLGTVWAMIVGVTLASQTIFYVYAAENRVYMY